MQKNDLSDSELSVAELEKAAAAYRKSAKTHARAAKNQWKVFLTTGLFVLALVAVFLATAAWFSNNTRDKSFGMKASAEKNILVAADYEIFKAHDTKGSSFDRFMFGDVESISMNSYDAVINQNLYTAVYLRIPIESVDLGLDNVTGVQYSINCSDDAVWVNSAADADITRYLSSIVQVKCYAFPDIDEGAEAAGDTAEYFYNAAKEAFSHIQNAQQYVAITNDGANYTTTKLTFTIPKYNDTDQTGFKTVTTLDGSYRTYLYVEINYSSPLVAQYLGLKNGHIELGQPVNVDQFYQDMIEMELSAIETAD